MNQQIILERDGQAATIKVLRPEALNALSRSIVDEMDRLVEEIRADISIRVLLFYSEENFAAGADIKAMAPCGEEGTPLAAAWSWRCGAIFASWQRPPRWV